MLLSLGKIDDPDESWFNGQKFGANQSTDPEWNVDRKYTKYTVPRTLVKVSKNLIVVCGWDSYGSGGFSGPAQDMFLPAPRKRPSRVSTTPVTWMALRWATILTTPTTGKAPPVVPARNHLSVLGRG